MRNSYLACLLATAAAISSAQVLAAPTPTAAASTTTAAASDLRPDPAARIGQLPNGMRYVIYRNATPPGQVSVRLRFDAGDLMERDEQNGLAHFTEHMAFNGTTRIPEGELVKMLERQGLRFGIDTNAFTAPDQTVYMFDIPASSDEKIDTALFVMREIASEIRFDPAAIERERGIIQSEDRSMYPPVRRGFVAQDQFLFRGQLLSRRSDIGNLDVIRTAGRDLFLDYYRRYYRPERATLVLVGDVDPAAVEAKIRGRFADWKGTGEPGADPDQGRVAERGSEVASFVLPGAIRQLSLNWLQPYEDRPDSRAVRIEEIRRRLTLDVLQRRLNRLAQSGKAPFLSAGAFEADRFRTAHQTQVSAQPKQGEQGQAAEALEREVRRLVEHGVLAAELEQEIRDRRSAFQSAVAGASTRKTPQLANGIVSAINQDEVVLSPAQELALFEDAVKGFTPADAGSLARRLFSGSGPLLFATSPTAIEGGEKALADALATSRNQPVQPPVAVAAREWPYRSFGSPGRVVERAEVADLGLTRVRFANGVNLIVKPTSFAQDQVIVTVRAAGGMLALPPELVDAPLWQGGFTDGGLARMTAQEITETFTGRTYTTQLNPVDDALQMRGVTRPRDFGAQMQLLAAYATDAGWREDAFDRKRAELLNIVNIIDTTPANKALTRFGQLIRSGDGRWAFPTTEELKTAQLEPLKTAVDPMLKTAPLEVVIVGNVSVGEAIAQTAATFGALPKRSAAAPRLPGADRIAFTPANAEPHRLQHSGRPDVGFGIVAWPTDDFYDNVADSRALQVLRALLQNKTMDKLREELGATYSPMVIGESSEVFDEFGFVAVGAEVKPSELDALLKSIAEVADELRTKEVSADDMKRARDPMLAAVQKDKAGNDYWANRLAGSTWEPRRLAAIRTVEQRLQAVTPADIKRVARLYLNSARAYRLIVEPEPANAS